MFGADLLSIDFFVCSYLFNGLSGFHQTCMTVSFGHFCQVD